MDSTPNTNRTWVAGEVVTASLLNTHVRDNIKVGRGYQRSIRTAGSLTLNSTSWANTSTTLDLTLAATTGDVFDAWASAQWSNEAVNAGLNFVMAAAGNGYSTKIANTDLGAGGYFARTGVFTNVGPPLSRTVVTADISGGNVISRIRHRTGTAANKTLQATTSLPLTFHVRNHGPNVAP